MARRDLKTDTIMAWQLLCMAVISVRYHVQRVIGTARDPKGGKFDQKAARGLGRALIRYMKLDVEVIGAEHLEGLGRFTVASNHASYIDWAFILGHLPTQPRFVAKAELRKVPVVGSYLAARGILINRSAGAASQEAIREAAAEDSPWPLLIFPEGTRTNDGEIRMFKRAGLRILAEEGVPIVPLILVGTYEAFSPHARFIDRGRSLRMVIGEPIDPTQLGADGTMAAVESAIRNTYAAHRPEVAALSESRRPGRGRLEGKTSTSV